jgi:hypothetical protein
VRARPLRHGLHTEQYQKEPDEKVADDTKASVTSFAVESGKAEAEEEEQSQFHVLPLTSIDKKRPGLRRA